jgi:hypothetical protein
VTRAATRNLENDAESRFRHSDFGAALHPSRVTSGIASETRYNSICDNQALGGASRVAEVVGPVTLWHEACLWRAGHGLSGTVS